jgi:hypothetical protein
VAVRIAVVVGGWSAGPAGPRRDARASWLALHAHWRSFLPEPAPHGARAESIAAVIDHRDGAELHVTLQSLAVTPAVRRVIVLNRTGRSLGFPTIDLLRDDPEALDLELMKVAEDAVLLIHSGVAVLPDAIAPMLRSLQTAADVDGLLPASRIRHGLRTRIAPPLGGSAAFSFFEGVTFTGALLVRRDALLAAKRHRSPAVEAPFLGLADFCIASAARIWPYAEAATERMSDVRLDVLSSLPARVAVYSEASAADRYYMLAGGYAANLTRRRRLPRELALSAVDHGFGLAVRLGLKVLRRVRRLRG